MQPNTKMSSGQATFDLKAAREIALDPNFYGNAPYLAANLNDALDEIERLQNQSMHDCISCRSEAYQEGRESQAKRIAELEADLTTYAIDDLSDERLSNRMANHSCKHNWVNMAPNNHMTCSKCGKVKG